MLILNSVVFSLFFENLVNDSTLKATTFTEFEYKNIKTTNCFEWERVQQLQSGYYLMSLILEGRIAAEKTFELK